MHTAKQLYYTISASLLAQLVVSRTSFDPVRLNIVVSSSNQLTPGLYQVVNALEGDQIISLSASLLREVDNSTDVLPAIFLLIAMNRSSTGQNIIPVFTDDNSIETGKVRSYLLEQGIENVKFPFFSPSRPGIQSAEDCSMFLQQQFSPRGIAKVPVETEADKIVIVGAVNEIDDLIVLTELIKQLAGTGANPDTHSSDYFERHEIENEMELWRKRARLYQDFLPISKKVQQKEYYDMLSWYQKEYEVLPLWYKRFGHIIKMLAGKRTFRSLFSDKVKKHKT